MRARAKARTGHHDPAGFARAGRSNVPRPLAPAERRRIEAIVTRLIGILDQADGDPDREEGGDDEPSLGSPETVPNEEMFAYRMTGDEGVTRDKKTDQSGWSDGRTAARRTWKTSTMVVNPTWMTDDEPSLGSLNVDDQSRWSSGGTDDGEQGDDNGIADADGALEQGWRGSLVAGAGAAYTA